MAHIQQLKFLRPLGKLEQVSASCHHLGFFNNVGVSAHYRSSSPASTIDLPQLVYAAAGDVIRKHRILSAIPINEDAPNPHFASLPELDLRRSITFFKRSQPLPGTWEGEDKELDAILERQHQTSFKADYGILPFWRLVILQSTEAESEFTASFIYHHAVGDGVSGLVFHKAFQSALEAASSSPSPKAKALEIVAPDDDIPLLLPLEDLHPLPINPATPGNPTASLEEWTGKPIHIPCVSRWSSLYFSPRRAEIFFQHCKQQSLSVTSVLSSIIATALFGILPPTTEALTCIIPVSLRPWLNLPREAANGAIGTYFDATKVQFTRPEDLRNVSVPAGAQKVAQALSNYLANVSPSGEPYTAVAPFKGIPDVSVIFNSMMGQPRDAAFEVTNIGLFSSSLAPETDRPPVWEVSKVLLSRSSVASGAAVTISVATGGDGSMAVGFSWQEGVVEQGVIDELRERVAQYIEQAE